MEFHGTKIEAILSDGRVWIAVRRVCEALGLDARSQLAKLRAKPWATVVMNTMVAEDGKERAVACLDLDALPMWLATIEPGRVSAELRERLVLYQRDAARVLRDHFFGSKGSITSTTSSITTAPPSAELPAKVLRRAHRRLALAEKTLDEIESHREVLALVGHATRLHDVVNGLGMAAIGLLALVASVTDPEVRERYARAHARWSRAKAL